MGYLDEIERELRAKLHGKVVEEPDEIIFWVKEKILESYRNGQAAGPKADKVERSPAPSKKLKPPASPHGN